MKRTAAALCLISMSMIAAADVPLARPTAATQPRKLTLTKANVASTRVLTTDKLREAHRGMTGPTKVPSTEISRISAASVNDAQWLGCGDTMSLHVAVRGGTQTPGVHTLVVARVSGVFGINYNAPQGQRVGTQAITDQQASATFNVAAGEQVDLTFATPWTVDCQGPSGMLVILMPPTAGGQPPDTKQWSVYDLFPQAAPVKYQYVEQVFSLAP